MEQGERRDLVEQNFKGFAANLLLEVIRADMSMHDAQLDAWRRFIRSKPKGELINNDVMEGIPASRYLFLEDVNLSLHVTPLFDTSLVSRIKAAWMVLTGRRNLLDRPMSLAICAADDPEKISVSIRIVRDKNGTVKASYSSQDQYTNELLDKIGKKK